MVWGLSLFSMPVWLAICCPCLWFGKSLLFVLVFGLTAPLYVMVWHAWGVSPYRLLSLTLIYGLQRTLTYIMVCPACRYYYWHEDRFERLWTCLVFMERRTWLIVLWCYDGIENMPCHLHIVPDIISYILLLRDKSWRPLQLNHLYIVGCCARKHLSSNVVHQTFKLCP